MGTDKLQFSYINTWRCCSGEKHLLKMKAPRAEKHLGHKFTMEHSINWFIAAGGKAGCAGRHNNYATCHSHAGGTSRCERQVLVYLPRGLVLAEVCEGRDEPGVDLVERQLFFGRIQDRLQRREMKRKH